MPINPNILKEVGSRLKALRKDDDEGQKQVCALFKVTPQTWCAYEKNGLPGVELVLGVCEHYDVTVEYLLTGEEGINGMSKADEDAILELWEYFSVLPADIQDVHRRHLKADHKKFTKVGKSAAAKRNKKRREKQKSS
jgi:transcriptional regulator with XRE-family HTH domain